MKQILDNPGAKKLYDALSDNETVALPDYDTFVQRMGDETMRRKIYDALSENETIALPGYEQFSTKFGPDVMTERVVTIDQADKAVRESLGHLPDFEEDDPITWWGSIKDSFSEAGKGVKSGTLDILKNTVEVADAFGLSINPNFSGVPSVQKQMLREMDDMLASEGFAQDEKYADFRIGDLLDEPAKTPAWLSYTLSRSVPQMAGVLGLTAATGGGALPAFGANSLLMSGSLLGDARKTREEKGEELTVGDKAWAFGGGLAAGAVETVADMQFLKNVFRYGDEIVENSGLDEAAKDQFRKTFTEQLTDRLKESGKGTLKQMPMESATEAIQTTFENVASQQGWDPDVNLLDGVAESAFAGAVFPVPFGTVRMGVDAAKMYREGNEGGPRFIDMDGSRQGETEYRQARFDEEGQGDNDDGSRQDQADNDLGQGDEELEGDKGLESKFEEGDFQQARSGDEGQSGLGQARPETIEYRADEDIVLESVIGEDGSIVDDTMVEQLEGTRQARPGEEGEEGQSEKGDGGGSRQVKSDIQQSRPDVDLSVNDDNVVVQRVRLNRLQESVAERGLNDDGTIADEGLVNQLAELDRNLRKYEGANTTSEKGKRVKGAEVESNFFAEIDETNRIRVYDSRSGREVGRRSPNYAPAIADYLLSNEQFFNQSEVVPESEATYLEDVSRESTNPIELANAYLSAKSDNELVQDLNDPKQAIADFLKGRRINTQDFKDFGNENYLQGTSIAMQYLSNGATRDLDTVPRQIQEAYGVDVTIDDIIDFIVENPGGAQSYLNSLKSDLPERISARFEEVTGAQLDDAVASAIGSRQDRDAGSGVSQSQSDTDFDDVPFSRDGYRQSQTVFEQTRTAEDVDSVSRQELNETIRSEIEAEVESWQNREMVEVVDTIDGLPAPARTAVLRARNSENITGVFFEGVSYVIADRHSSSEAALRTLYHEMVGHFGLRGFINQVASDRGTDIETEMNALLDEVFDVFSDNDLYKQIAGRYGYDLETEGGRRKASEEFLAKQSEFIVDANPTMWQRIVQKVRDFLKRAGIKLALTKGDVEQLLFNAYNIVQNGAIVADGNMMRANRFGRREPKNHRQAYKNVTTLVNYFKQKGAILEGRGTGSTYLRLNGKRVETSNMDEVNRIKREYPNANHRRRWKGLDKNGDAILVEEVIYGGQRVRISNHDPVYYRSNNVELFYTLDGTETTIEEMLRREETYEQKRNRIWDDENIRFSRTSPEKLARDYFVEGRTVYDLIRENPEISVRELANAWNTIYNEEMGSRQGRTEEDGFRQAQSKGRPDLANPVSDERVRQEVDRIDQMRNEADVPRRRTDETIFDEAKRRLADDYEGERERLFNIGEIGNPERLNDVDVRMMRMVLEREGLEAVTSDDSAKLAQFVKLTDVYRRVGTEQGRGFRQRQDDLLSPAERMGEDLKETVAKTKEILSDESNIESAVDGAQELQKEIVDRILADPDVLNELDRLRSQVEKGNNSELELEATIQFLTDEISRLEQDVGRSNNQKEALQKVVKSLKERISKQETDSLNIERNYQETKKKLRERERKLKEAQQELEKAKKAEGNIPQETLDNYLNPLRDRINELTKERDDLLKLVDELKKEVSLKKRQLTILRNQLKKLQLDSGLGLGELVRDQAQKINRLKNELKKLREDGYIRDRDKKDETDDERAIRLLSDRIAKEAGSSQQKKTDTKKDPVLMMVDTLYGIVKDQLNRTGAKRKTPSRVQVIQDAIKHKEAYRTIWEQSKEKVLARFKGDADAIALLEQYFGSSPYLTFGETKAENAIRTELKLLDVDINDLVTSHYETISDVKQTLIDRFITDGGLSLADAELMAKTIEAEFDRLLKKKRLSFLKQILNRQPSKKEQKRFEERVAELIKAGAFDLTEYRGYLAEYMGLPVLRAEQAKALRELVDAAESAGTIEARNKALQDLSEYILTQQIVGGGLDHTLRTKLKKHIDSGIKATERKDDVLQSARQRRVGLLLQAMMTPSKEFQKRMEGASEETRDELSRLYLDQYKTIKDGLLKKGIDLSNLTEEDLDNPETMHAIIRSFQAANSNWNDKAYEYWINSILSGIGTHQVNITGNIANTFYEMFAKRWVEASLNLVKGDSELAQFGEIKHYYKAWFASIPFAWEKARLAWSTEHSVFSDELGKENIVASFKERQDRGVKIDGKTGRIVRIPSRFLLFADELAKAMNYQAQVAALAFRQGKAQGKQAEELERHIADQLASPDEQISEESWQYALELAFQEDSRGKRRAEAAGKSKRTTRDAILTLRESVPFGRYVIPFITTVGNLLRQGVRKSPLGIANVLFQAARSGLVQTGLSTKGEWIYDKKDAMGDIAEQVIAWGGLMVLAQVVGERDEDDLPYITGTGSSFRDYNAYQFEQKNLPRYSIRVPGSDFWFSYERIEPLSTVLALSVDALESIGDTEQGQTVDDAVLGFLKKNKNMVFDKSYLKAVGDINTMLTLSGPDALVKFGADFTVGWVPNIIRQTARNTDDWVREQRIFADRKDFGDYTKEVLERTGQKAIPVGSIAPLPKVDWLGREIKKDYSHSNLSNFLYRTVVPLRRTDVSTQTAYDRMILSWNNINPGNEWYPSIPSDQFTVRSNKIQLTESEYNQYLKKRGAYMRQLLDNVRSNLSIEKPTQRDMELLDKLNRKAGSLARNEMIRMGLENQQSQ